MAPSRHTLLPRSLASLYALHPERVILQLSTPYSGLQDK